MNYESSPFQGYSSISVDDLKDQANSLLNLVTEEQRPLRVFMNNGKEFFLFPQDMLAPISDSDFRLILLSAMRYAMRRKTHMSSVVADYIKRHLQLLDDKFLALAVDDIQQHLEYYAEHEPNPDLWQNLLDALETERSDRGARQARKIRPCPTCGKPLEIMSIADSWHSPSGFDVIAHCRNCHSDYEWFCDKDGSISDMKQYFFG
jgi:PHD/YefM family antitoxin component YafN of YafNO toxin-antitoxin module